MVQTPSNHKTVGKRAQEIYEQTLRGQVETEDNIGKIIVIDVETGNYEIDADGLVAAKKLRETFPTVKPQSLFAIRIGYDAVFAVGGTLTRSL